MKKLSVLSAVLAFGLLSGCATTDADGPGVRVGTDGSHAATQASAQNIAPITSYIANVR